MSSTKSSRGWFRYVRVSILFRVHACACECVRLICVEWYTGSAQYAGHHRFYDSMIVGPLVAQSNVLVFYCSLPPFLPLSLSHTFSLSLFLFISCLFTLAISHRFLLFVPLAFLLFVRLCLSPFLSNENGSQTHPVNPRRILLFVPYQYSMPLNCFLTRPGSREFYFITWLWPRRSINVLVSRVITQRGQRSKSKIFLILFTHDWIWINTMKHWTIHCIFECR